MAKKQIVSRASPPSSGASTPIYTPPSVADSTNGDGGAPIHEVTEALTNHTIADNPRPVPKVTKPIKPANPKPIVTPKPAKVKQSKSKLIEYKPVKPAEEAPKRVKKTTVVGAFDDYFGDHTQLENWQKLCKDLGIDPVPGSITQCRKALKKVWVNIWDFLDAIATDSEIKQFKSQNELARYTIGTRKFFPKNEAKKGGPVRALLAHISSR